MLKTEKLLSQLLLFFLPSQLSFHFWPEFSLIFGVRVDYLSPTIYLTDLIIIALIIIFVWNRRHLRFFIHWFALAIFALALINVSISLSQPLAVYKWIRIAEYLLLGFILTQQKGNWYLKPLSLAAIYTSIIAFVQLILQKNISGALYWLGERPLSIDTAGLATVEVFDQQLLRPYASFPHPNVLGAFGLISLLFILPFWKSAKIAKAGILSSLAIVMMSFSQAIWIAVALLFIVWRLPKTLIKKLVYLGAVILVVFSIGLMFLKPTFKTYSLDSRIALAKTASYQLTESPILGMGLGNFIPANQIYILNLLVVQDARLRFQPVHNVPLLLITEVGVVGFMLVTLAVLRFIKNATKIGLIGILLVYLISLVDHYWVTLHQGTLLLTLILVQLANGKVNRKY